MAVIGHHSDVSGASHSINMIELRKPGLYVIFSSITEAYAPRVHLTVPYPSF